MYTFPQVKEPRGLTQGSLAKAVSSPHHPPSPRSTLDPVPETHACDLHLPGYLPNSWAVSLRAGAQPQGGQIGASHLWLEPPPLLSIYPVPRLCVDLFFTPKHLASILQLLLGGRVGSRTFTVSCPQASACPSSNLAPRSTAQHQGL